MASSVAFNFRWLFAALLAPAAPTHIDLRQVFLDPSVPHNSWSTTFSCVLWVSMHGLSVSSQLKAFNNCCLRLVYKVGGHEEIWFRINLITKRLIPDWLLNL